MSKRFRMWAYMATLLGGAALLSGGCGWGGGSLLFSTLGAILQEDLFG